MSVRTWLLLSTSKYLETQIIFMCRNLHAEHLFRSIWCFLSHICLSIHVSDISGIYSIYFSFVWSQFILIYTKNFWSGCTVPIRCVYRGTGYNPNQNWSGHYLGWDLLRTRAEGAQGVRGRVQSGHFLMASEFTEKWWVMMSDGHYLISLWLKWNEMKWNEYIYISMWYICKSWYDIKKQ